VRGGGTFTKDPADLFGDVRNWIKMRLRRYGVVPTAIWTIENSPAGDCPHMHVYLHLPPKLIPDFHVAFASNYPGDRRIMSEVLPHPREQPVECGHSRLSRSGSGSSERGC